MTLSRIFIYLCLAFILGIFLNSLILVPQIFIWGFFIAGLTLISVLWLKNKQIVIFGFCLLIFAIGIYRHQMFKRPQDSLDYYRVHYRQETKKPSNFFYEKILGFKSRLQSVADSSLSPPQSILLQGIMLGEVAEFSKDFKEKLNRSGTRHITAISGMNITILAEILMGLGLVLGMWRGQAFYFALASIILFIIMIGAPPSAVRAGIMGGIVLFAEKVGRLSQAQRLLTIAAMLMLAHNPLLLRFDVGFQLSFLATLGIIKLSPWFLEKFSKIPRHFQLRNVVAMTFPAVIFTAPILAYNFGQVSLISIFTNILIVPVVSFILGLGLFAGMLGIFLEPIGQILFLPVWALLTYVYKIIDWSAQIPFAALHVEVFPWYMVALYFALLWWGIKYFKLEK